MRHDPHPPLVPVPRVQRDGVANAEGSEVNGLSLCAGVGGLDLGLHLAVPGYRTIRYVEREAFAAAVLVARMADSALDRAAIWDDLSTLDCGPLRGRVDLVSSGLPCQPYSLAGKQRGHDDERALWPHFVRIVSDVRPGLVFIENVPPFLKHFEPVWRELRELGFVWGPPLFHTASEAGAPHIRRRFFALAAHPERVELRDEQGGIGGENRPGLAGPGDVGADCADADVARLEGRRLRGRKCSDERASRKVGDTPAVGDGRRCESEWSGWLLDEERPALRHDADRCGDGCRICGTTWEAESPVLRVDDGPPDRVDRLRAIGNVGAPPVVYARAFLALCDQLGVRA